MDYNERIILHSPQQTLDDIYRVRFEGCGDLHETHLDAIEHMLKILPPSHPRQNSSSASVVFCTSDTKPTKSGISAEELGAKVKRLGITLFLVCEMFRRTPQFETKKTVSMKQ